ncbi:MAG: histidine--tRNA ligase [Candidatus Aenigmarchaeota archaeon]|nr:histidine--tRNA ligase [Candidatus Aenigmarchaeota archaeon]
MKMIQTPRGTRDFLPETMARRQWLLDRVRSVFERFGFDPLETPAFESWELLSRKGVGGQEIRGEIYYFKDKSERGLGLRFDLTVPLARVVANNPQLILPFRRYQIGRVWRYDRPGPGRYREFWQADADIVGSPSMEADAECIAAAVAALKELGFRDFAVRLNSRKILNGLVEFARVEKEEAFDVFRSLDKLEKIGEKGVLEELEAKGIGKAAIGALLKMIKVNGKPGDVLEREKEKLKGIRIAQEGIAELEKILEKAKAYGIADKITIDFSLVRGLDYYTGPIFEVAAKTRQDVGSVAGGGRYDRLVGLYGGRNLPAVGISLGVERLFEIMEAEGMFKLPQTLTQLFVVAVDDNARGHATRIAGLLREKGINVQADSMGRPMRSQLEYVNRKGIPYALFVGERELKEKKFVLKDMGSGKQDAMDIGSVVVRLRGPI